MAQNNSFRNFGSMSKKINSQAAIDSSFDNDAFAEKLANDHQVALTDQAAYDEWAKTTLLSDVTVDLADGRKFSDLFAVSVGNDGEKVVTFNPGAPNGSSWSKNESGFVNALLTAFGTRRYSDLRHGLHDRRFDRSLVIEHNVRSVYNAELNKWVRYDWNNGRFTQNTPNPKSDAGAGWLSKHVEIDRMLMALLGKQSLVYHFFSEYAWNRFETNVLNNMQSLVSKVNVQLANQSEQAQTIRTTERKNAANGNAVTATSVVVDGIDLKKVGGTVKVQIKMRYSSNPVTRTIDTTNAERIAYVSNTMQDADCEYVKIVQ